MSKKRIILLIGPIIFGTLAIICVCQDAWRSATTYLAFGYSMLGLNIMCKEKGANHE